MAGGKKFLDMSKKIAGNTLEQVKANTQKASEKVTEATSNAKTGLISAKDKVTHGVVSAIDENGNGEIDIEDIIIKSFKTPGIKVDRAAFLQKEFFKHMPQEQIGTAITFTPAIAGVPKELIDQLADDTINFERNFVSGISAALGVPGGIGMAATVPADVLQYYGYMLRAAQKLLYLYGFPQLYVDENGSLDTETLNTLILCLGVMYGAAGANNVIKVVARALAKGVSKKIMKAALTKGVVYPILKSFMKWFSVNLTKKILANAAEKAIPVVGAAIGGGLTFFTFKPCCVKLKKALNDTFLSNSEHIPSEEEDALYKDVVETYVDEETT